MSAKLETPILFLLFNRPDTTRKVFEAIKRQQPQRLYIAADGARAEKIGEKELCEETRNSVIKNIDWDCEVKTLLREKNLGCKIAVSSAITWFFENEEQGIILEDDCLPNDSFFSFCEEMLNYYKDDERIMHIGGSNFQDGKIIGDGSYFFSNVHYIWGWATWRRAWKKYDVEMKSYNNFISEGYLKNLFPERYYQQLWESIFEKIISGKLNTWDYQWTFSIWINNGLGIIPNQNLISNIGFSGEATHTQSSAEDILSNRATGKIGKIKHPSIMQRNYQAEKYTLDKYLVKGFKNKLTLSIKKALKRG